MSLTNPQELTARILNPRSKHGIKSSSANRSAHFSEEAHLPHQEATSPEAARQMPTVSVTGFQNIPPPSALFRTTMASWRHNQQRNTTSTPVPHVNENIQPSNNQQSMASLPRMTSVSKNKTKEHARQLGQLARLQTPSGAITKKSSSSSTTTPYWRRNPLGRLIDSLKRSPSTTTIVPTATDPDVVQEFDRDISEFLVSVSGSFLGINPSELMQSTGLRQLIARNMRWFQNTPDWMKVVGLLIAKKFNGEVRNRNAFLEASISSFNPLLTSSSSSSFVSEGLSDEALETQPLLLRRSMPIPIPDKSEEAQEDHIPFTTNDVVVLASLSPPMSSENIVQPSSYAIASNTPQPKNKKDKKVKNADDKQKTESKKRKVMDKVMDVKEKAVKKIKKHPLPTSVKPIDVIDVDAEDEDANALYNSVSSSSSICTKDEQNIVTMMDI